MIMILYYMRKAFIAISLLFTLGSSAQATMSHVFKTMPENIVPYISENNRLDLVDFVASNMKAVVNNLLDGKTELTKLTDSEASLKLNESVKIELRLLNVSQPIDSANQIICMIHTFNNGEIGSQISFYTIGWRKLATSDYISLPDEVFVADFEFQNNNPILVLTFNYPFDKPASDDQKELSKALIKYNWDKITFKQS